MILRIENVEYSNTVGPMVLQIDSDIITSIEINDNMRKKAHPFALLSAIHYDSFSDLYIYGLIISTIGEPIVINFDNPNSRDIALTYIHNEMINPIVQNNRNKFYIKGI